MEQEYVVESILQAQVARKRKGEIVWKYLVKWKDYDDPDENTWEPSESFSNGSEHFITTFWNKAMLNGRDRENPDDFKPLDVIYPMGPPGGKMGKKHKRKSQADISESSPVSQGPVANETSEPEVESILKESPSKSKPRHSRGSHKSPQKNPLSLPKRDRSGKGASQKTSTTSSRRKSFPSQRAQKVSPEDVAPEASTSLTNKKRKFESSDNESLVMVPLTRVGPPKGVKKRKLHSELPHDPPQKDLGGPSSTLDRGTPPQIGAEQDEQGHLTIDSLFNSPMERTIQRSSGIFSTLARSETETNSEHGSDVHKTSSRLATPARQTSSLPFHRVEADPRVKLMGEPDLGQTMTGALSVEAKLTVQNIMPTSTPQFYAETSPHSREDAYAQQVSSQLARDRTQEIVNGAVNHRDNILEPEQREAFLQPVTAAPLLGAPVLNEANVQVPPEFEVESEVQSAPGNLTEIKESSIGKNTTFSIADKSASWMGNTTIFGLLTRGSLASSAAPILENAFTLNLDTSVSVPVVLKDVSAASTLELPPLGTIMAQTPRSPPGKFYKPDSRAVLLDTLRTGGPSARLLLKENAVNTEKEHFDRFRKRLLTGDIFVVMAGPYIVAITSLENQEVCDKLGIPAVLRGLVSSEVVVSAVVIDNHSAYAEAALLADDLRWL